MTSRKNIPPGEKVTIVVVSKERLIDFFLGVDNKLCVDLLKRNMSRLNGFLNMLPIFIYNNADWGAIFDWVMSFEDWG